ncbi:hypothetical protein BH23GEM9_BH23GEM9_07050 [soil metagenome]
MPVRLSPPVSAALNALCRRIVPSAFDQDGGADVVAAVEQRIMSLDPPLRSDVIGAIHFFDHPITGMLLSGRPRRFCTLPAAEQDALLHEWERSPLGLRRTVFQALRRIILVTYYSLPQSHAAIGVLVPLHLRPPAFPWEGPVGPRSPAGHRDADSDDPDPNDPDHEEPVVVINEPVAREGGALPHAPQSWPPGILRGNELPDGHRMQVDVCIVGSGAGGSVMADRLATAGYQVVVLEEGGFFTGTDFDDDEGRLAPLLYADGAARATDDLSVILLQGRCLGGGTTVNWMMTLRPQPWVLDEWENEHRIELLSARMLLPALEDMEERIHARAVPADAHSPANRVIIDGCARLGWDTLDARINARGCIRAGACGLGCRSGAKQGAGDVFLPPALRAGATICCDTRADSIEVLERGSVNPMKAVHATLLDPMTRQPRGRLRIDTRVIVLAAGAIGTPALLDRSGMAAGGVGRFLRLHPTTGVFGDYEHVMYGAAGLPQSVVCSEFLKGRDGYGFWIECAPLRPGLVAAALQGFGDTHRGHMRRFTHTGPLIVLVRDGADRLRSSGDVRVDRSGRVHIRYRLTDTDRATLAAGVQAAARLHLASGARTAITLHVDAQPLRNDADIRRLALRRCGPNRLSLFSAHVNGTCRLGHDPRVSGCTPEAELHGVAGIFVADGSLLPTAPGVNPQATIMALSSLVADRVMARLH